MPTISVIMPVYNGERYVRETIHSVLQQTYTDFEYIIVDDGSTDKTKEIVDSFSDHRIVYVRADHTGIIRALNLGLEKSSGTYVVRIDADDMCEPHRFETLFTYMNQHTDVVLCGSWATKIDEQGKVIGKLTYPPVEDADIRTYMMLHNPCIHPSVIMRKDSVMQVGGYRNFKHTEDYELWTRMLQVGKGHNIPEELIRYRVHAHQVTRKVNLHMRLVGIFVRLLAVIR